MTTVSQVSNNKEVIISTAKGTKPEDQEASIMSAKDQKAKAQAAQKPVDKYGMQIVNEPKPVQIKVKAGVDGNSSSLGGLAEQYRSTVAEIVKANDLKDPNKLKSGQELIVPSRTGKDWDNFRAYQDKYTKAEIETEQKAAAVKHAKDVEVNTIIAKNEIINAKAKGLDKKYEFKVNSDGNLIIKLKKSIEVGDIITDFKLNDGILLKNNEDLFGTKIKREDVDGKNIPYNYSDAPKDLEFLIPPTEIGKRPEKSFWQRLFD